MMLVVLVLLPLLSSAVVRNYYFRTLGGAEGLAQGSVTAMLQDRQGFVWIATTNNLQRFDGYTFEALGTLLQTSDFQGKVQALAEDADGQLYIGTRQTGLIALDPARHSLTRLTDPASAAAGPGARIDALLYQPGVGLWVADASGVGLFEPATRAYHPVLVFDAESTGASAQVAQALALDPDDTLWIGTNQSIHRIDTHNRSTSRFSDRDANALVVGNDGELWIGAKAGLYRKARHTTRVERLWPLTLPESGEEACCDTTALAQAGDGSIWLSVRDGNVWHYTPALQHAEVIATNPWIEGMLAERDVPRMMIDRSNLLWLGGTNRGVITTALDGAAFRTVFDLDPTHDPLSGNFILSVLEDDTGALWLGTRGGLRRYDPVRDRFEAFSAPPDPDGHGATLAVADIEPAADGKLWLATQRGLYRFDPGTWQAEAIALGTGLAPVAVNAIARLRDGTLWLGCEDRGLLFYDPANGDVLALPRQPDVDGGHHLDDVTTLLEDSRHRVWIGGTGGLSLFDPASRQVRNFAHDPEDTDSISGNVVHAIHETRDGDIWIGTDHGLDQLAESTTGQIGFRAWPQSERGPIGPVEAITEDRDGLLWVAGNRSLMRLDRGDGSRIQFDVADGLQTLGFNARATALLRDGHLAFGGMRGLTLVEPARSARSSFDPPIAMTWIAHGQEPPLVLASPASALEIPAYQPFLRMGFAALDYTAPRSNLFSYLLEGFDTDFTPPNRRAWVLYSNLAPGQYVLRVRATNHSGVWSANELRIPIRVPPPWWMTLWAYLGYAALLLFAIVLAWRTQQRRAAQHATLLAQIREREDRLKLSLWGAGDSFWDWNLRNNMLYRIGADQLLQGPEEQQVSISDWRENSVHPDDLPRVQHLLQEHLAGRTKAYESEHRIRNAQDGWTWIRARGKVVERDAESNPLRMAGTARDIGPSRQAERERRIASEVLRSMNEAVAVLDLNFRFASVNPAFLRITGYGEKDVLGMPDTMLESSRQPPDFLHRVHEELEAKGHYRGEIWLQRFDGDEFLGWVEVVEICDEAAQRTHFVAVFNDITEKKRTEQELRYLANYDTLTGLPNRSLLSERLARAVVRARRHDNKVAVLFLDLDHFNVINDSLGHAAGDRVLKATAARLLEVVGSSDTVARLGGDEFTIVMEDVAEVESVTAMAQAVIAALGTPLLHEAHGEVVVSPSIGISLYPDHALVPVDLLKFADAAMYRAKDRGRNTFQFYDESMDAALRRRATMTAALRGALDRDEFHLEFQPRQSLFDQRIVGVEALLRWTNDAFGEVSPDVFIPLAEESGLILPLGAWVMEEACRSLHQWLEQGIAPISVAVNVSVLQLLRGDLPATVAGVLAKTGLAATALELEITESIAMANAEQTRGILSELKRIGVGIVIDDFGTGYSSLIYLKRLPIDALKIDREFVSDLIHDPDDEAIVATIISMAHSLGLTVVAEGVETQEQLGYLREQGCDEIQGFLLARPMRSADCLAFLRQQAAPTAAPQAD